ncbi:hypothetical protein DENSPDRAFT_846284 [Dentipellis sp. KUC8613]|nr:hypothetical protein DENSPDRAFT_846284 [Dentipellis sp. KUC8613]
MPSQPSRTSPRRRAALLRHTTPFGPTRSRLPPSGSSTCHVGTRVLCHCTVRCRNGASCVPACHPTRPLTGCRPAVWRPHWVCRCCTCPSNGAGGTPPALYPSAPAVSCRAGPSNGVGITFSYCPTL